MDWKTANEVNVNNYTVERSADGLSFIDIISVNASAVAAAAKQYEAFDRLPAKGVNYYRIRQTDKDGRYSYSKTVQVNVGETAAFVLWPNPASSSVTVQSKESIQRLQYYNGNGQLMYDIKPAAGQYTLPVQQWAAGVYHVKITIAGKTTETRFIKK